MENLLNVSLTQDLPHILNLIFITSFNLNKQFHIGPNFYLVEFVILPNLKLKFSII